MAQADIFNDNSIVAYYKFNNNYNDEVNGNNLIDNQGGNTATFENNGKFDECLSLLYDTANDTSYNITSSDTISTGDNFSASLWIYTEDTSNTDSNIFIRDMLFNPYEGEVYYGSLDYESSASLPNNEWVHLAQSVRYDSANSKYYATLWVNGDNKGEVEITKSDFNSDNRKVEFSAYNGNDYPIKIDHLRVFNKTLTQDDVNTLYNETEPKNSFTPTSKAISVINNSPILKSLQFTPISKDITVVNNSPIFKTFEFTPITKSISISKGIISFKTLVNFTPSAKNIIITKGVNKLYKRITFLPFRITKTIQPYFKNSFAITYINKGYYKYIYRFRIRSYQLLHKGKARKDGYIYLVNKVSYPLIAKFNISYMVTKKKQYFHLVNSMGEADTIYNKFLTSNIYDKYKSKNNFIYLDSDLQILRNILNMNIVCDRLNQSTPIKDKLINTGEIPISINPYSHTRLFTFYIKLEKPKSAGVNGSSFVVKFDNNLYFRMVLYAVWNEFYFDNSSLFRNTNGDTFVITFDFKNKLLVIRDRNFDILVEKAINDYNGVLKSISISKGKKILITNDYARQYTLNEFAKDNAKLSFRLSNRTNLNTLQRFRLSHTLLFNAPLPTICDKTDYTDINNGKILVLAQHFQGTVGDRLDNNTLYYSGKLRPYTGRNKYYKAYAYSGSHIYIKLTDYFYKKHTRDYALCYIKNGYFYIIQYSNIGARVYRANISNLRNISRFTDYYALEDGEYTTKIKDIEFISEVIVFKGNIHKDLSISYILSHLGIKRRVCLNISYSISSLNSGLKARVIKKFRINNLIWGVNKKLIHKEPLYTLLTQYSDILSLYIPYRNIDKIDKGNDIKIGGVNTNNIEVVELERYGDIKNEHININGFYKDFILDPFNGNDFTTIFKFNLLGDYHNSDGWLSTGTVISFRPLVLSMEQNLQFGIYKNTLYLHDVGTTSGATYLSLPLKYGTNVITIQKIGKYYYFTANNTTKKIEKNKFFANKKDLTYIINNSQYFNMTDFVVFNRAISKELISKIMHNMTNKSIVFTNRVNKFKKTLFNIVSVQKGFAVNRWFKDRGLSMYSNSLVYIELQGKSNILYNPTKEFKARSVVLNRLTSSINKSFAYKKDINVYPYMRKKLSIFLPKDEFTLIYNLTPYINSYPMNIGLGFWASRFGFRVADTDGLKAVNEEQVGVWDSQSVVADKYFKTLNFKDGYASFTLSEPLKFGYTYLTDPNNINKRVSDPDPKEIYTICLSQKKVGDRYLCRLIVKSKSRYEKIELYHSKGIAPTFNYKLNREPLKDSLVPLNDPFLANIHILDTYIEEHYFKSVEKHREINIFRIAYKKEEFKPLQEYRKLLSYKVSCRVSKDKEGDFNILSNPFCLYYDTLFKNFSGSRNYSGDVSFAFSNDNNSSHNVETKTFDKFNMLKGSTSSGYYNAYLTLKDIQKIMVKRQPYSVSWVVRGDVLPDLAENGSKIYYYDLNKNLQTITLSGSLTNGYKTSRNNDYVKVKPNGGNICFGVTYIPINETKYIIKIYANNVLLYRTNGYFYDNFKLPDIILFKSSVNHWSSNGIDRWVSGQVYSREIRVYRMALDAIIYNSMADFKNYRNILNIPYDIEPIKKDTFRLSNKVDSIKKYSFNLAYTNRLHLVKQQFFLSYKVDIELEANYIKRVSYEN